MCTHRFALLSLLCFHCFSSYAHATSFASYKERLITDANGRYYVVVKRLDKPGESAPTYGPVSITIAERRPGSLPVQNVIAGERWWPCHSAISESAIRVRPGDIVHGRIKLEQPPSRILVSATGKGIVTLDRYGFNHLGPEYDGDLVIYSLKGQVVRRCSRKAIFDEVAHRRFLRRDGYTVWLGAAWLDEVRGQIVLVGYTPRVPALVPAVTSVELANGLVKQCDPELIDRAIEESNPSGLVEALDHCLYVKSSAGKSAWPRVLADERAPLTARVKAAALMGAAGDRRGASLLKQSALGRFPIEDKLARFEAVEYAPTVLGKDAAPLLCDFVRLMGDEGGHAAWSAMREVPVEAAIPELRRLLTTNESIACNLLALECLGMKGAEAKDAIPDILKILKEPNRISDDWSKASTHEYAQRALERIKTNRP